MQDLDVLYLPLHGVRLIEASAGTGKTYNLILIYLRLLLNLQTTLNLSHTLTVKNILVVTFTKAAVQELRLRIKTHIQQLQLDCIHGYSNNYLFSRLLTQINNKNIAINLLSIAEQAIDQASIFTIHGFCQKILIENRLELSTLFHTSIAEHTSELYQQICSDFWRRQFYSLPLNIVTFIQQFWKNPEELLSYILPYIHGMTPKFQYDKFTNKSDNNILNFYATIINIINNLKKQWLENQHNIIDYIQTFNINRKIYHKNNLTRWIHTINLWATKTTLDHTTPNHLDRFRSSVLQIHYDAKKNYMTSLFFSIETLYQKLSLFPALIINIAIYEIRQNLKKTQHLRSQITFNDLIDLLSHHISENKNNFLYKKILQNYPVAIIDEFQDTDFNQYKIFQTLYSNQSKNNSLILIGDPKQAIYSFRGADIFSYMKIRNFLPYKYNLNINWRSSPGMVNAINQLFQLSNPFIFPDIAFTPVKSAYQNDKHKLLIKNQPQKPICFWVYPDNIATIHNYKTAMTTECVYTIQNLLSNIAHKTVWLENNKYKKKILKKSDIAILVRNHEEASLIRSELLKIDIPTIFLSNRKNIFETIEAYELLLLLQAVLSPSSSTICTALTTIFFKSRAITIEKIHNKIEPYWTAIIEEFNEYYIIWEKHDIFSMIQKIIFRYKIPEQLFSMKSGKNNLINILHLGELLNKIAKHFYTKHELIQWLYLKIDKSLYQHELSPEYILRHDDNDDLVKISTIHQSKGLEFPITLLPFMANFQYNKKIFFHDRTSFELYMNFDQSKSNIKAQLSDEERLSDDLRLLYVAITRSIYHCSIGVAPIICKYNKKKNNVTDLHRSAIGYLIQNKKPGSAELLKKKLYDLNKRSNGDIDFRFLSHHKQSSFILNPSQSNQILSAKKWNTNTIRQNHHNTWNITSYSKLKKDHNITKNINFQNSFHLNLNNHFQKTQSNLNILTAHTFPKGKVCGNFFHGLFKVLDFKKPISTQWLQTQMILYNIDLHWITTIRQWIYTIINTPLNKDNLTLSKITNKNKKTEFKFLLNINTNLTALKLNSICKHYDTLSRISPVITFETIQGMLKGFIDLVFYWNQKYYVLDYKTNWLGDHDNAYTQFNIELEFIKYRYDLQYQIYTLALHRFLKNKIIGYNYNKNFGGVYYLFIRGMDGFSWKNSIHFCYPIEEFINKLDNLF